MIGVLFSLLFFILRVINEGPGANQERLFVLSLVRVMSPRLYSPIVTKANQENDRFSFCICLDMRVSLVCGVVASVDVAFVCIALLAEFWPQHGVDFFDIRSTEHADFCVID